VAIIILRRRNKQNKPIKPIRVVVPAIIAALVLSLIYGIWMPQSYILRFTSPERAYKFTNEVDCTHVIYGENSALAIAFNEDNSETSLLVLKDGDKWSILPPFLNMGNFVAYHNGMSIYAWDNKRTSDLYVEVSMMSVNPSSTKQIMLNDQAARAEIIRENKNINAYAYNLFYCLDGNTNEITIFVDGEAYGTVQVNRS
jgi:asparagine N-glycosylation enzyme membrane subunit Stt3